MDQKMMAVQQGSASIWPCPMPHSSLSALIILVDDNNDDDNDNNRKLDNLALTVVGVKVVVMLCTMMVWGKVIEWTEIIVVQTMTMMASLGHSDLIPKFMYAWG